jgi:hypothetical protein
MEAATVGMKNERQYPEYEAWEGPNRKMQKLLQILLEAEKCCFVLQDADADAEPDAATAADGLNQPTAE